jgi:hypothetical protein
VIFFQSRYDGNNDHVYRSEVDEFREVNRPGFSGGSFI